MVKVYRSALVVVIVLAIVTEFGVRGAKAPTHKRLSKGQQALYDAYANVRALLATSFVKRIETLQRTVGFMEAFIRKERTTPGHDKFHKAWRDLA